jgi:hypothetical protein
MISISPRYGILQEYPNQPAGGEKIFTTSRLRRFSSTKEPDQAHQSQS